jgi:two-component system, LytTR family, response regulator
MQNRARSCTLSAATTPARAIIVEDELHARRYLRALLEGEPRIDVVAESSNGADGLQQIESLCPDIAFVDVQMPSLNGLDMIERIASPKLPFFVLVTGHCEHAVKAFELEAVDYLCKPFDEERLTAAVERTLRRLHACAADGSRNRWISRLEIADAGRGVVVPLPVDEIIWIEAANRYVVIHTPAGSHTLRQSIQGLEKRLDPSEFVRTHRSALVRKAAVREVHEPSPGNYMIELANGAVAPLSRACRLPFFRAMIIPHRI